MHWRKICIRTYTLPPLLVDVQQQHKHNQLLLSVSRLDSTRLLTRLYLLFYLVLNGSDQGFLVTFDISINWKEECTSVLAFQVYVLNLPTYPHSTFFNASTFVHVNQRWSNLFFWTNPNPNIIRILENFRIRIRILFEILKKIRIYSNLWKGSNIRILFE